MGYRTDDALSTVSTGAAVLALSTGTTNSTVTGRRSVPTVLGKHMTHPAGTTSTGTDRMTTGTTGHRAISRAARIGPKISLTTVTADATDTGRRTIATVTAGTTGRGRTIDHTGGPAGHSDDPAANKRLATSSALAALFTTAVEATVTTGTTGNSCIGDNSTLGLDPTLVAGPAITTTALTTGTGDCGTVGDRTAIGCKHIGPATHTTSSTGRRGITTRATLGTGTGHLTGLRRHQQRATTGTTGAASDRGITTQAADRRTTGIAARLAAIKETGLHCGPATLTASATRTRRRATRTTGGGTTGRAIEPLDSYGHCNVPVQEGCV
ncbi:hypothetical protein [Mycolicibacterium insubricum]|uniref:Uncharacterized protein n=1 Tax=Mycolicibacterium insubricum TaxID=444597 RepID=A0A1X0D032_9MYCO|nr:hypothetical protein [Mycolicibacterium insubricum]MCV7080521.1 hypothetical protein [Mycolicibacterium insubricum]ORA65723.1 hypothetical protein BST26_18180 [Mycolicibacterium insubricum]